MPNLEELRKQAYVEGFQIALGVLFADVLAAVLLVSLISKVATEEVTAY